VLDGGAGSDQLFGGLGADLYVLEALTDGTIDTDVILGYWKVGGDSIDLPQGDASIVAQTFIGGDVWQLTLAGDGDAIRLENVVDAGTQGTILDDLLIV
jgi:hypothetical protein